MPLKLISDGEASSRPIGPVVNGRRTEAVSRLMISPSRVVAMHFSSASQYNGKRDNKAILWNDLN